MQLRIKHLEILPLPKTDPLLHIQWDQWAGICPACQDYIAFDFVEVSNFHCKENPLDLCTELPTAQSTGAWWESAAKKMTWACLVDIYPGVSMTVATSLTELPDV